MYRADSIQPLPTARQHSLYAYAVLRCQLMLSRQNMFNYGDNCCGIFSISVGSSLYLYFMLAILGKFSTYIITYRI